MLHLERFRYKLVAAGIACLLDTILEGIGTKCQYWYGGGHLLDDTSSVETVHLGHSYVHKYHVGVLFLVEGYCLNSIARTKNTIAVVEHTLY